MLSCYLRRFGETLIAKLQRTDTLVETIQEENDEETNNVGYYYILFGWIFHVGKTWAITENCCSKFDVGTCCNKFEIGKGRSAGMEWIGIEPNKLERQELELSLPKS